MAAEGGEGSGSGSEGGGVSPSGSEESWEGGARGPLDGAALRRLAATRTQLAHAPALALAHAHADADVHADDIDGVPSQYIDTTSYKKNTFLINDNACKCFLILRKRKHSFSYVI